MSTLFPIRRLSHGSEEKGKEKGREEVEEEVTEFSAVRSEGF
jgi:hypothetical protein